MRKVRVNILYSGPSDPGCRADKIQEFLSSYVSKDKDIARGIADIDINNDDDSPPAGRSLKYMEQLVRVPAMFPVFGCQNRTSLVLWSRATPSTLTLASMASFSSLRCMLLSPRTRPGDAKAWPTGHWFGMRPGHGSRARITEAEPAPRYGMFWGILWDTINDSLPLA